MSTLQPLSPLQQGVAIVDGRGGPSSVFMRAFNTVWTNLKSLLDAANRAQATANAAVPQTRRINTTAPILGGGDLTADRTLAIDGATAAQYRADVPTKVLATDAVWSAATYVALTDAATIAVDLSMGINFTLTIGGNRTLGAPANVKEGQTGVIVITQDGTGGRTLAYNAAWKFAAATAPVLSTGAGQRDLLFYQALPGASTVFGNLVKNV